MSNPFLLGPPFPPFGNGELVQLRWGQWFLTLRGLSQAFGGQERALVVCFVQMATSGTAFSDVPRLPRSLENCEQASGGTARVGSGVTIRTWPWSGLVNHHMYYRLIA